MFEAAEATGRTGELDIACLNTVMETAARLRLPGLADGQPVAADARARRLQRPRPAPDDRQRIGLDPRQIVLELTEREAVEDSTGCARPSRRAASPASGWRPTTSAPGNAGLRLLSQLRFDIVKIDLSLVQGGAVRDTSLEIVRTLRDLADRWGALVVAEGIETPAQLRRRALARDRRRPGLPARAPDRPSQRPRRSTSPA